MKKFFALCAMIVALGFVATGCGGGGGTTTTTTPTTTNGGSETTEGTEVETPTGEGTEG